MWENQFSLEFCSKDEKNGVQNGEGKVIPKVVCDMSHPMDETKAGFGNRYQGKHARKLYEMFFIHAGDVDLEEIKTDSHLAVSASLEQTNYFLLLCTFGLFSFGFVLYWFSAKQKSQSHLEVEFYNEF